MKKITLCVLAGMIIASAANAQIITTEAGNGTASSTGDGGSALAASFNNPAGAYYDAIGNIYVVEYSGHRIRKINTSGIVSTFAGTGTAGFAGDGGPATAAKFHYPIDLVDDAAGNVYIVDNTNHRIRKVDVAGNISTYAGNGTAAYSGDGGPATAASLRNPNRMTIDAAGNIFIADAGNNVIRKISSTGIITTVVGTGVSGFSGDGGPATAARMSQPLGVGFDGNGNMYIADGFNRRIRKVNPSGIISTIAGNGISGTTGDGGPATAATMQYPNGIAVDATCNVYFTDWSAHTVRRINTSGYISTVVGIPGSAGFTGDGGPSVAARINGPDNLTFDPAMNLYIPDFYNNRIRMVANLGEVSGCPPVIPSASFTSSATTICEDSCLSLTSTSTGLIDSIRWQITPSGATISAPTSVVTSVCFPLSGTYNIRLKAYGSGYVDSSSTTVFVTPSPSPLIVRAGTTLSILGGPYTGYQWYNGTSLIAGATSATYTFSSPSVYTVVVDSAGCKGTSNALNTLSVNAMSANAPVYWVAPSGSEMLSIFSSVVVSNSISVTVRDITGRIVTNTDWLGGTNILSISTQNFASGLYIISLTTHEGIYPIKWFKP